MYQNILPRVFRAMKEISDYNCSRHRTNQRGFPEYSNLSWLYMIVSAVEVECTKIFYFEL